MHAAAPLLAVALALASGMARAAQPVWIASWGQTLDPEKPPSPAGFTGMTLRETVHLSAGGTGLRLLFSNAFGARVLRLGSVHVARTLPGGAIVPGTDRVVTFAGKPAVDIPANATRLSDTMGMDVHAGADLSVSVFITQSDLLSAHINALAASYLAPGDQTGAARLHAAVQRADRVYLQGVEVTGPQARATLVALGDSITDGNGSVPDTNGRWPDLLAGRLTASYGDALGVVNAGIAANMLLGPGGYAPPAVARLDRDALHWPAERYILLLEGINDCLGTAGGAALAAQLFAADRAIVARAHALGIKVAGMTLTPIGDTEVYTVQKERARLILNTLIRHGKAFDAVIDADAALRDPERPDVLLPAYDSGDHLHPGPAGMRAIAAAVPLEIFKP
jgi:lysophospholipase L1-like esterase